MAKEIDQLDLSTAIEIYDWFLPSEYKSPLIDNTEKKSRVRNYLRVNKITPYEALEQIRKQKASMPKRIF